MSERLIKRIETHAESRAALRSAVREEGKRIAAAREAQAKAAAIDAAQKGVQPSE